MNNFNLKDKTLTLLFTSGTGLKTWADVGNIDREIEIYKKLSEDINAVNFITYGGNNDNKYLSYLGKIKLLPLNNLPFKKLTLLQLQIKYSKELNNTHILKTNQILGSDIAIYLKEKYKKKLIIRCGYLHSYFTRKLSKDKRVIKDAEKLERHAFETADIGVVTSNWQRNYVIKNYQLNPNKIQVVPNYVNTDIFKPIKEKKKYNLIYVGRDGEQKNLGALLESLIYLKKNGERISLLLIGSCSANTKINEVIRNNNLSVECKSNVSNFELPVFLNQAEAFIIPSFYEGHPKALLEAMSCQMPVIGTSVDGIKSEINHMENGILCGTDYKSIAKSIKFLFSNEDLQRKLGRNARKHIMNNYSFDKVYQKEINIMKELTEK